MLPGLIPNPIHLRSRLNNAGQTSVRLLQKLSKLGRLVRKLVKRIPAGASLHPFMEISCFRPGLSELATCAKPGIPGAATAVDVSKLSCQLELKQP